MLIVGTFEISSFPFMLFFLNLLNFFLVDVMLDLVLLEISINSCAAANFLNGGRINLKFWIRCQPWTITLTGVLIITSSWLLLHSSVVTAGVLTLICAWWYIFLYSYPKVLFSIICLCFYFQVRVSVYWN